MPEGGVGPTENAPQLLTEHCQVACDNPFVLTATQAKELANKWLMAWSCITREVSQPYQYPAHD
jgi:hypothetical protein